MRIRDSEPTITGCTFSGNTTTATEDNGVIYNSYSDPIITNCILWENGEEIHNSPFSSPIVTYCDIQGGYSGTGNIDTDPLFDSNQSDTEDDNYGDLHLQAGSPCIDAGTSDDASETDKEGNPRWDNPDTPNTGGGDFPYYDMGAYEYLAIVNHTLTPPPDTNVEPGENLGPIKVSVTNNADYYYNFSIVRYLIKPDGQTIYFGPYVTYLAPGESRGRAVFILIPADSETGTFTFGLELRDLYGNTLDSNSFDFTVVSGPASGGSKDLQKLKMLRHSPKAQVDKIDGWQVITVPNKQ